MGPTRRRLLEASGIVFAAGLAGCLGGDDADATTTAPDGTASETDAATTTDSERGGGAVDETTTAGSTLTVQVREHEEYGAILVDGEGMSLYMFDSDTQGAESSTCSGGCASAWPPLTVEGDPTAGENVTAPLSTFERDSGDVQVAADGWPLYYYASDEDPGDATGQGANDVWWLLDPSGEPIRPGDSSMDTTTAEETTETPTATPEPAATVRVRAHDELGDILVDSEGMTLYMFDSDTQGAESSACTGGCASAWPPLTVEGDPTAGESVTAALETFERDSGDTQVAADGWPLYYYASDEAPGDATGQGANDVWWVLDPSGEPKRPATATPTPTPTPTDDGGDTTTDDGYY